MYDFDALVTEVLRNKPEISRDSLMDKVKEKKRTVGSGYLTDQGALFLIAGELGVGLQHLVTADLTLKDLQLGANDITVVARILGIYPVSEYKKKDGSGMGHYRKVNLFDRNGVGRLTIWEDNAEAMKLAGVAVDSPVRVASAYVKPGLDGKPNLNLGKRGRIELITEPDISSKLAPLSELSKRAEQVEGEEPIIAVDGLTVTDSRRSTFVRRDDGSTGSLTQFELKGQGDKTTRVVIWDGVDLPEVRAGTRVRVTNLRPRKGRQGDAELHGDSATTIRPLGEGGGQNGPEGRRALVKVAEVLRHPLAQVDLEVMALAKGAVRDVSLKDGSTAKKGEVVLGDDTGEVTAVAWGEAAGIIADMLAGERLYVHGAKVQLSKMGVATLELGPWTKVERPRGRGQS